ncbi:MAG: hypothetical protein JW820_07770 [Spirochaetales bacterium]|nr:hypothetical protein [Spirochaetales bacterium]
MRRETLLQRLRELEPQTAEKELFARILCGEVRVDGVTIRSAGQPVPPGAAIELVRRRRFVSRGGEKLDGVLERWKLEVAGLGLLDAGASTGGFTDCLLQRGARAVLAVERGFNQLDFRLRRDPRVTLLERTNVMDLQAEALPIRVEAAVADLSLRSLRLAAAHILSLTTDGWLVALVKPQYERLAGAGEGAGAALDRRAGVLENRREVLDILRGILLSLGEEGLCVVRGAPSPLPGTKGNREFFFQVRRGPATGPSGHRQARVSLQELEELVAEAFAG